MDEIRPVLEALLGLVDCWKCWKFVFASTASVEEACSLSVLKEVEPAVCVGVRMLLYYILALAM